MTTDLPAAALDLARVFAGGGRLVVAAPDRFDHAQHVAVEFIHPAITGAKSLPAIAVPFDDIDANLREGDALLVLEKLGEPLELNFPAATQVLVIGRKLSGPALVRWYHVLWELVQLGLEHPGLTGGSATAGGDSTSFLYPFLDASESSDASLLESSATSWEAKEHESEELAAQTLAANNDALGAVASMIRSASENGGTTYAIGNGGSSCDAARLVRLLTTQDVPARSLAADTAILTALANDLGIDKIFARQVEAMVRPGDVLVAFSTSGSSSNLLAALDVAARVDARVVVSAGYGGGLMGSHHAVDHALIVDSTSVHRIQEAQGVLIDQVCDRLDAQLEINA